MKAVSSSVRSLQRSGIRAVMDVAFQRGDVLRLEVGDPDFPTPPHIVEAAARAARDGYTHYTSSRGLLEVREVMAHKLRSFNGIEAAADDIVVTPGGAHGVFSIYRALTDPGDAVLVPDPGWPNYRTIAALCGIEIIGYPLMRDQGFLPDLERLEHLMETGPDVKAIVVNSPSNPTGSMLDRDTLQRIIEMCDRHDLYLISDECYEAIVFESEHLSPATLDDSGRTISAFSVSKTYAMTGWRVGYVTGPTEVMEMVGKVVESSVSCASAVSQKAAEAAISGDQSEVERMVEAYRSRRDLAVERLREAGLWVTTPSGAFYVMADAPPGDTLEFAMRLVDAEGVTVAPGEAFGPSGTGMVRLSLASDPQTIDEGIRRLARFIGRSDDTAEGSAGQASSRPGNPNRRER